VVFNNSLRNGPPGILFQPLFFSERIGVIEELCKARATANIPLRGDAATDPA